MKIQNRLVVHSGRRAVAALRAVAELERDAAAAARDPAHRAECLRLARMLEAKAEQIESELATDDAPGELLARRALAFAGEGI